MQANNIFSVQTSYQYDFLNRNLPRVIRSNGTVEDFDPRCIKNSIMKETSIPEHDAHVITEEIMRKLLSLEQKTITAPFIREQVCIVLHDHNPKWRFEYTRLGIPYNDFKEQWSDSFEGINDQHDLDNGAMEKILSSMDKKKLVEMVRRMARDYIGVRNNIKTHEP